MAVVTANTLPLACFLVLTLALCAFCVETTTHSVVEECASHNKTCDDCVSNPKCLFCFSHPQKCVPYPVGHLIPSSDVCDLGNARWGLCMINYKALLIAMGCLAGVLLISFSCCIYCCCCRSKKGSSKSERREDQKFEREREERRTRNADRKSERNTRVDEIREKYGLTRGTSGGGYQKFDNEA